VTRVYGTIALALGALGSYDVARGDVRGAAGAFGVTVIVALAIVERLVGEDR
jgi:hypothetical protein